jgi:hypothetical protein
MIDLRSGTKRMNSDFHWSTFLLILHPFVIRIQWILTFCHVVQSKQTCDILCRYREIFIHTGCTDNVLIFIIVRHVLWCLFTNTL